MTQFQLPFSGSQIVRASAEPVTFTDLVLAGSELVRAQFLGPMGRRLSGIDSISAQAGRLLFERGAAPSVDAGIVIFHEAITTDKPSLRKILRRADERAGRRPRRKRSAAQKLVAQSVKAGLVDRAKDGRILRLKPSARAAIKRASKASLKERVKKIKAREQATLRRLGLRKTGR